MKRTPDQYLIHSHIPPLTLPGWNTFIYVNNMHIHLCRSLDVSFRDTAKAGCKMTSANGRYPRREKEIESSYFRLENSSEK